MLEVGPHLELTECQSCKETRFVHKTLKVCKVCFEKANEVYICKHVQYKPWLVRSVEVLNINDKLERVEMTCEDCRLKKQENSDGVFDFV
jgi:hypothetical protein